MKETSQQRAERLKREFRQRFGAEALVARAPGRVNIIGEHTDYNDGFVLPAAIDFSTWVAAAPRDDGRFVAQSLQFPQALDTPFTERKPSRDWTDYVWGVVRSLRQSGFEIGGASLLVEGDVPIGSGLSSSAALEVSTALALLSTAGLTCDTPQLAKICQRAENEFVGARCGIMDQFISAAGKAGHALLLDCRSLEYDYVPVPAGISIVICNTMVKHSIAGGEYNQRRAQCEQGVELLRPHLPGIRALRDVTPDQFEAHAAKLPELIRKRCRHVVDEDARVLETRSALRAGDLARVGALMYASHVSLRDDYEVSCPELDIMVELARRQPGLIGARMTGGGFGGCTVNLVQNDAVAKFVDAMRAGYEKETKIRPDVYASPASQGAERIA